MVLPLPFGRGEGRGEGFRCVIYPTLLAVTSMCRVGRSYEMEHRDGDVDQLDADERDDDAAETVNQQVALQDSQRTNGFISDPTQCQRDQRDNDQGVENDRTKNGTG